MIRSSESILQDRTGENVGDEAKDDRHRRLRALAANLLEKRDEAIKHRKASGVERRWREDQAAFDGEDVTNPGVAPMIDYATGEASARGTTGAQKSQAYANVIRGKCETAEGRFADILLPVDDRNWGLQPTPVPDLVKGIKDDRPVINTATGQPMTNQDGSPVKAADIARVKMERAKEAMGGMEDEIDDKLTECKFNGECRKVIKQAIRLGTGVLKGPSVIKNVRKAWTVKESEGASVHVLETVEEPQPISKSVSPWNVYPAPECSEDASRAPYVWEADDILPRELTNLIGIEGYFEDQIMRILKEDPIRTEAQYDRDNQRLMIAKNTTEKGNAYEKWEYHGDVDREDLEVLGVDCEDLAGQSLSACVVFVNDHPIKIMVNVLDTGDMIYDFFQWTQVDGSPWGIGVPRQSIWMQRIIIASLRAMMDNARDSSGANVIVGHGVAPADGVWELTGKKIWKIISEDVDDARKAFGQFQLQNNQAELQALIELALRFLDMETSLPMLFQGEQQEMPETLGATNIVVDAQNVALRTRVKIWDDQITTPHITRYYHWMMQYSDKDDIKGDYNVDARGSSVLLARDQQARALVNIFKLRGDPEIDAETDWGKATRQLFEALHLDIGKTDEQKKRDEEEAKNKKPQEDPSLTAARIRSEAELEKAKLNQQADMAELQLKAQMAKADQEHELRLKVMDREMRMMEFAQQSGLALADIKADLAKEASKQSLMREMADKKTAQLTSAPIEPPGKAPEGQAYSK
jgi:hypothetical protein